MRRFIHLHTFSLIVILLAAAVTRFIGLSWDSGLRLHPDEALIVNGALSMRAFTQWFPGFHDYNGFLPSLLRIFSPVDATPMFATHIGRFISALVSVASVGLIYGIASRWWNKHIGLIAAILLTFTPLSIQLAHFYTTESMMVWLLLMLLYSAPSPIGMAVASGLLLATKNTAYLMLPIPLLILFIRHTKHRTGSFLLYAGVTILTFFLASPYTFLDLSGYLTRAVYLSRVVSGTLLMDWTVQFLHTSPVFWLPTLSYALGPVFFIGIIGLAAYILHTVFVIRRVSPQTISAFWSVGFLVFLAFTYLKFTRYVAPALPILILFAAKCIWDMRRSIGYLLIALQLLYGVMFLSVYMHPHTAVSASSWLATHVPKGSSVLVEEWNSIIPLASYHTHSFNMYTQPDTEQKLALLQEQLETVQYIILESPKVYHTITRLKTYYPYTASWYESLTHGQEGFVRIATFTSYPRLGSFFIDDSNAEETWTVFDHPTITIYQKSGVCQPGYACTPVVSPEQTGK